MEKMEPLCGALLFLLMSILLGTNAQSRNIWLCQDKGGAQNNTSFPAQLGGSVNVTLCVMSPYYPLYKYAFLMGPGSFRKGWIIIISKTISEAGLSRWLLTYTISDLRQLDFTDKFVSKVYLTRHGHPEFSDPLVFTFSFYEETPTTSATTPATITTTALTTTPTTTTTTKPTTPTTTTTTTTTATTTTTTTPKPQCPDQTNTKCPKGWTATGQGKCLKLVDREEQASNEALLGCESMGADLLDGTVDVLTDACIRELIPYPINIWVSGCKRLYVKRDRIIPENNYNCWRAPTPYICFFDENNWAPAEISAFQLSQGDPSKGVKTVTHTDLKIIQLQTIRIKETENFLTFSCNATGLPLPQVSINYNNVTIITSSSGSVTYVLGNATCKDSGLYSCQANNSFGETVLTSPQVEVLCPVEIISFTVYDAKTGPGNFLLTYQSHPVSFSCEAEGNPTPNIMYIQNERKATLSSEYFQNSVRYNTNNVQCPDMGGYYCKVDTRRNDNFQERVELAVSSCPVQLCNPSDYSTKISSTLGETVSIPLCLISYDGYTQSPRLVEKDNEQIHNRRKYSLEATKLSDSEIYWNATLWIYNVEEEDFGTMVFGIDNYNRKSPLTYTVYLKPEGPPSCPSNINVTNTGTSYITLSWQPGFDGGADQSFHVYHSVDNVTWTQTEVRGSANTYTLKGLTENTLYAIRVAATNKFTDPKNINEELCNSTVYHRTAAMTTTATPATGKDNKSDNSDQELTTLSIVFVILGVLATLVVATTALGLYFYCRFKRLRSHPWTSRTCPPQRDGSNIPATKQMSLTESGDRSNTVYQNTSGSSMTSSQHKDGQHVSETTHQISPTDPGNRTSVRYQNTNEEPVYEQPVEAVYEQPVEPVYEKISELVHETVM